MISMRRIIQLSFLLLLFGTAHAQVKISQLPTYPQQLNGTESIPASNLSLSTTQSYQVTPSMFQTYLEGLANTWTGVNTYSNSVEIGSPTGGALGAGAVNASTGYYVNGIIVPTYPRTAAEIAAGVTPVNYGYPVGYVDRYGTNTTPGTTVMLTAVQDAFKVVIQQGGGAVTFLAGESYYLGNPLNGPPLIELTNPQNIIVYGNGATILVDSQSGTNLYSIFDLQNPINITVIGLNFDDTGGNEQITWDGARAWNLTSTVSTNSGGFTIIGGTYTNLVSPFVSYWTSGTTGRVQHINLNYRSVDCYLGANFEDQGDDVTGSLTIIDSRRSYFLYGVTGHNITLNIYHDATTNTGGANGDIDIKRYQFDTTGDRITAFFHGNGDPYAGVPVRFEAQGNTGTFGITGLGSLTGGSGYTNGTYENVPLTGGSGTGAIANIEVTGGAVTGINIVVRGSGYISGDTLSASAANIGGTGSGFSVPVSYAGATISDITLNLSFEGYQYDPGETPVLINSLTPSGSEQNPTQDHFDQITINGTFGDWPTYLGVPINVESTQDVTGRFVLSGPVVDVMQKIGSPLNGFVTTAGTTIIGGYTVSTLPECSSITFPGFTAKVTDATSPTYNGTLTGSGSVVVPVFCNGSSWTAH